jgi:hypothetical protein
LRQLEGGTVRVTRVRTRSRVTPPLDTWYDLPERLQPIRRHREAAAKEICGRRPVRMLYALATRQRYGMWGGLTQDDRRRPVADERRRTWTPRGRPARSQR